MRLLFGWKNISFTVKELVKMYSNQESFFSKKRIESGVAFLIFEWGMIHWLILNVEKIAVTDLLIWASTNVLAAGYTMKEIQKEKQLEKDPK